MSEFFSFDTSAIINGRRDLLPPEVFPTLWGHIEHMIMTGSVHSIDVVKDELSKRDDQVSAWAKSQTNLFLPLGIPVQEAATSILEEHPRLMGAGKGRNAADPFVIALAIVNRGVVVTEELLTGNIANPRIPDVCAALSVPCVNLIGFIRLQGWRY